MEKVSLSYLLYALSYIFLNTSIIWGGTTQSSLKIDDKAPLEQEKQKKEVDAKNALESIRPLQEIFPNEIISLITDYNDTNHQIDKSIAVHMQLDNPVRLVANLPHDLIAIAHKTVVVYDPKTKRIIKTYNPETHEAFVTSLTVLPNGNVLFSLHRPSKQCMAWGGASGTNPAYNEIIEWNYITGKTVRSYQEIPAPIQCLAHLPNKNIIAAINNEIIEFAVPAKLGKHTFNSLGMQKYKGHKGVVTSLAAFKNGNFASGSPEETIIKIWNPGSVNAITSFNHTAPISCINILPQSQHIISGSPNGTIKEWSMENPAALKTYAQRTPISCLAHLANDNFLSGSTDGSIRQWSPLSNIELCKYGHTDNKKITSPITSIAILSNGNFIATSRSGLIEEWPSDFRTELKKAWDAAQGIKNPKKETKEKEEHLEQEE